MQGDGAGPKPDLRLLIVSNHGLMRGGLASLFQVTEGIEAVAAAATSAVSIAREFLPQVALIDLGTDADAALLAAESIAAEVRGVGLLFLDDAIHPLRVRAALESGAQGYWTTHASFQQITAAVRQVAAGETSFCPEVGEHVVPTADPKS